MRISICDDDLKDATFLQNCIKTHPYEHSVTVFSYAAGMLQSIADGNRFDLIFLDIQMPGLSGWEAAHVLKERKVESLVVLTTIAQQYVFDSFHLVWDFLVKPVPEMRIHSVLDSAYETKALKPVLLVTDKYQTSISAKDVVCVEVKRNYLHIYTASGDEHRIRSTLIEFENDLSLPSFARPHHSYLVNLAYIKQIQSALVVLSNGSEIPVSRNRSDSFRSGYIEYLRGSSCV